MRINENTYNAIMGNAARAYHRESWLIEASDMAEAIGIPVAEAIEGYFAPFCDRLVKATEGCDDIQKLRDYYFVKFSEMVL